MRGMARGYAAGDSRGPGWREIAGTLGQLQAGRQAGSGMACSRAKARLNWVSQGQRRGRCKVRRRAERVIRPTSAQRIGVVDAVAACQRGSDQRQHLVPSVRPSRRAAEVKVMVDEFPQAQVPGEGGRQEQAAIGHQAMVVKEDADTVGIVLWQHLASSRAVPKAVLRWIRVNAMNLILAGQPPAAT